MAYNAGKKSDTAVCQGKNFLYKPNQVTQVNFFLGFSSALRGSVFQTFARKTDIE